MNDLFYNRVIDTLRLQNNTSPLILSSGTSGNLRHQLESTFVRTEIRIIQHSICIQNTYHADMVKIQSFRNHLRAYQYISFPLFEICNDTFVSWAGTGSIQIHACNSSLRKQSFDIIFYLLCSKPSIAQVGPFTSRACAGQLICITAIMASQLIQSFMKRQAHIAVLALRHPSTCITFNHRGKATPVLEQDNLFFLRQSFMDILK